MKRYDPDKPAQIIVEAVVGLSVDAKNIEQLANMTGALHEYALLTNAYKTMEVSLYLLDEYVDLLRTKQRGEVVNETYLNQLREELLNGRI